VTDSDITFIMLLKNSYALVRPWNYRYGYGVNSMRNTRRNHIEKQM